MPNIKLEHIDNLRRGKKSGAKIGSRGVPHHLYKYEEAKYTRALTYKYLEITTKDRVNLKNIWYQACLAQGWKNYILLKDKSSGTSRILLDEKIIETGDTKPLKKIIRSYV